MKKEESCPPVPDIRYVVMNEERNSKRVNATPERTPTTTATLSVYVMRYFETLCSLGFSAIPNTWVRAKR